jgi:hypothetical protein
MTSKDRDASQVGRRTSSPLRQGRWLHLTNRLHSLTTMLPHGLLDDSQDLGFDVLGQQVSVDSRFVEVEAEFDEASAEFERAVSTITVGLTHRVSRKVRNLSDHV